MPAEKGRNKLGPQVRLDADVHHIAAVLADYKGISIGYYVTLATLDAIRRDRREIDKAVERRQGQLAAIRDQVSMDWLRDKKEELLAQGKSLPAHLRRPPQSDPEES